MRRTRAFVETFADDDAALINDESTDARVGVRDRSKGSELQGPTHERNVALMLRCLGLAVRHVLPFVLDSCSVGLRGANGEPLPRQAASTRSVEKPPMTSGHHN